MEVTFKNLSRPSRDNRKMIITFIDNKSHRIVSRYEYGFIIQKWKKHNSRVSNYLYNFNYLYEEAKKIIEQGDISSHYQTIYIPKKNNTKRRIDIPDEVLRNYQKTFVSTITNNFSLLFSKASYAYIKGRNPKQMAKLHTDNAITIKMDIKDFFSSLTLELIVDQVSKVYPFGFLDREVIETILKPCMIFFDDHYRLPQGAPSSPLISNLAMIPFDFYVTYGHPEFVYTRYADDIVISITKNTVKYFVELPTLTPKQKKARIKNLLDHVFHVINTNLEYISKYIEYDTSEPFEILENLENVKKQDLILKLNHKKNKILYHSHGNVWMLGISVGESIKFGNKKKQVLKASLWSFLNDCKNGNPWDETKTRQLLGRLSYARFIEPDFVANLTTKYEQKTGLKFRKEVKKILHSR